MPTRRLGFAALAVALLATAAQGHHGVIFTADDQITVTGPVVKTLTGFPHFEIRVQEGETRWAIDLGNPFRIKKAGLQPNGSEFRRGRVITVRGHPALNPSMKVIEARAIIIDGHEHVLFDPDEIEQ